MAPGTRLLLAAMQEAAILVHVITYHAAISHLHQPLGLYCQRTVRSKCSQSVQVLAMAGLSPSRLQDPGGQVGYHRLRSWTWVCSRVRVRDVIKHISVPMDKVGARGMHFSFSW